MSEHGNGQPAVNGEATRAGAGRYSGPCPIRAATSGAEVAFVQWLCYHEDERDALRAVGLDADVIGDLNPDGRHLVIVTGAGDLYGVSKSLDDAQAAYGAGALTVRIVLVPTARGSTARHLLDANVIDRASLEGLAEAAEPIPDYHIEPWPELCLQEEPEALPFPVEVFSEPLRRFCLGVASVTLTPPDMAGCAMLAVASAAIGQSCQILVKRTWRESPLLFLLTVADPGKKKTPVLKLVGAPLSRIDAQLRNQSKDSRALWEAQKKALGKGETAGEEPPQRRAIVKDITRETLAAILRDNPRGVLADPDEATAWVSSFNEYKSKGSDRQFWLAIWAGASISVDREGGRRSIYVRSPLVTVMGGLPPDMLRSLDEAQGRNDGFRDRILFCAPDKFPKQRWTEEELDQGDETTWSSIIAGLHAQDMFCEENGELRPNFVGMEIAAKSAFVEWYNLHAEESESLDMPPDMAGAWSKLQAYCLRFSLILSRLRLALDPECQELVKAPVRLVDLQGAIALIAYFKRNYQRVNHLITGGTGSRDAIALVTWMQRRRLDDFSERDVRRNFPQRFPTIEDLRPTIARLVDAGVIRLRAEPENAQRRGRRPSPSYEVHPALRRRCEPLS